MSESKFENEEEHNQNQLIANQEEEIYYQAPEIHVIANSDQSSYIDEDFKISEQLQQEENEIFDNHQSSSNLHQEQDLLVNPLHNAHYYQVNVGQEDELLNQGG